MTISRNEFLKGSFALAVGAAACGDDDATGAGGSGTTSATTATKATVTTATGQTTAPSTTAPATTGGGMVASCDETIGANHPPAEGSHALDVPAADVNGGAAQTYDIQGQSAHNHTVALSAADMATLASGGQVMVTSSVELGHSHPITVSCA